MQLGKKFVGIHLAQMGSTGKLSEYGYNSVQVI